MEAIQGGTGAFNNMNANEVRCNRALECLGRGKGEYPLGQDFSTDGVMLCKDDDRLQEAATLIREINPGGTAIRTDIACHPRHAELVCRQLPEIAGFALVAASNLIEATRDCGAFVQRSGILKRVAVKLSRTCSDLGLLPFRPSSAQASGACHQSRSWKKFSNLNS